MVANPEPAIARTDVLVVGAGPTGLMAAALLARMGVAVRILDRNERQAHESRAFGVLPRSMELFLSMGLGDAVLGEGVIATGARVMVDGREAGGFDFDDIGRPDTPFPFVFMLAQSAIERIQAEDLGRLGVAVEHRTAVTALTQDEAGVVLTLAGPDGATRTIAAAYAIGADGAHSFVRKALGLGFEGAAYPSRFLLADCRVDWPFDHGRLRFFLRGSDLAIYLPLAGSGLGRIIAMQPAAGPTDVPVSEQGAAPATLDEVEAALRAASGLDIRLSEPRWVTRYRIHHRGVDRYRVGRLFVAGDAAHIHSPAGGQGMNTGLQDAANLAWKLALVLKHGASPRLLDSYHDERWPVGRKVLAYTDRLFAGMSSQTGWRAALRNRLVPIAASAIGHSDALRRRAFHFLSQLGIRYRPSATLRDGTSAAASRTFRAAVEVGHRAPNAAIRRGLDVFGLLEATRFHALALSWTPLDAAAIDRHRAALAPLSEGGLPVAAHLCAHSLLGRTDGLLRVESAELFRAYGLDRTTPEALFLVRPDGVVAWRADRIDVPACLAFLRRDLLGRP